MLRRDDVPCYVRYSDVTVAFYRSRANSRGDNEWNVARSLCERNCLSIHSRPFKFVPRRDPRQDSTLSGVAFRRPLWRSLPLSPSLLSLSIWENDRFLRILHFSLGLSGSCKKNEKKEESREYFATLLRKSILLHVPSYCIIIIRVFLLVLAVDADVPWQIVYEYF